MTQEGPQQNNIEQVPNFSKRYNDIYQKILTAKDPAVLVPLLELNREVKNHKIPEPEITNKEMLARGLTPEEIKEWDYLKALKMDEHKEWVGYMDVNIRKIQENKPSTNITEQWERLTENIRFILKNLKELDL